MSRYQPQQSVLNPQLGQRQTACMRNISVPQRSHATASDAFFGAGGWTGGWPDDWPDNGSDT
jgi:hypothetical protein